MATQLPTTTTYKVLRVPTISPRLADLVAKFRDTKLAALQAEPTSFAVRYVDEVHHTQSTWHQRLTNLSTLLACVECPPSRSKDIALDDEEVLLSTEWIGMATIRGPLDYSIFHIPESGQPIPEDPSLETRWHLCNIYTMQAYRGRGLAKMLVNAALAEARTQTDALAGGDKMKARVRLFCDPAKEHLVKMYERMSFQAAGMCTLHDALIANGDAGMVPEDTTSTEELQHKWELRYGLAMERLL